MNKKKFPIEHFFYISNVLSIVRLILIIPIVYLVKINTVRGNQILIILGIIIMLTDYLDGFFSRKLNQVTELGKFIDPLADKISMAVILVALIYYRDFPISLVVFLIYRDILILVFGLIIMKKKEVPESIWWGKVNTAMISFTGLLFLLRWNNCLFTIFLFGSYLTIVISGIAYYFKGEKILFEKNWQRYIARILIGVISVIVLVLILW